MSELEVSLFGDCYVGLRGSNVRELRGAKHRALIAMLATAPLGSRSRAFLQEALWGESCFDGGRQSLRRALSDLRRHFGPAFTDIFETDNSSVRIRLDRVRQITQPPDGLFLEGIDIGVEGFESWLRTERMRHDTVVAKSETVEISALDLCPKIAVLPFLPVVAERHMGLLGDWLAEDICRTLSRSHFLSVISHLSCRRLAGSRQLDLSDVQADLGVDYLLSGSLRCSGEALGLDVDLLDARTGRIIATRTFRGDLAGALALRCGMTAEISDMVSRAIVVDLMYEPSEVAVEDIDTHRLLVMGVGLMHHVRERKFRRGKLCVEEAVRRAPRASEPRAWLAKWHVLRTINGWSDDPGADASAARAAVSEALALRGDCALSLTIDGLVLNNLFRELDAAGERYRQALKVNPNDSLAWLLRGMQHAFSGDTARGVEFTEHAQALSPLDPLGYFYGSLRASAYCAHEDYEQALTLADRSISMNPRHLSTLRVRIAALHGLDRLSEARRAAQDLLRCQPGFRVRDYERSHPSAEFAIGRRMATALRASGIPY